MKTKGLVICMISIVVGVAVWAKISPKEQFSLAKNLPENALIYLQITDLPEFIKIIAESKAGEKYLASQNYAEFRKKRLGIKLAERFQDIGGQTDIPINLEMISSLSQKQAAAAISIISAARYSFLAPHE